MMLNQTLQLLMTRPWGRDDMMTRTAITPWCVYLFRTARFILSSAGNYIGIDYEIPCEVQMLLR